MACLSGENQTFVFITAPQLSSLSIAHEFDRDVSKKRQDKMVLENGTTILLRSAPLIGLQQDAVKKRQDKIILENGSILLRDPPLNVLQQDAAKKRQDKIVLENGLLRDPPLHDFQQDVTKKRPDKMVLKNGTTILLRAAPLHGLQQDVTKKRQDKNVVENNTTILLRTAPPHGLKPVLTKEGEAKKVLGNQMMIVTRTAPVSITHGLKKDVTTKEDQENLKKELEATYRKAYKLRLFTIEMIFEFEKLSFTRAMEKAWFINSIIKERCLISCHSGEGDHLTHHKEIEKVMGFNKKIKIAICLGLDGLLYGPSNKSKRALYQTYDQAVKEAWEEYNENLMDSNETTLQMVSPPEDRLNFENYCKKTCRRAYPFAELESREKYLESVINSLRERETERETKPTENEILGYMLLQEIANSTLHNTSRELLNSITLSSASADGDERDRNIHVYINRELYIEHSNAQYDFEMTLASSYGAFVMNAKSACTNSKNEVEQIKQILAMVEEMIRGGNDYFVMEKQNQNVSAVERRYERELFKYSEDLSYYMRLGRCLHPVSKTEDDRLKEIRSLASDAIDKYTQANGPASLPTITHPLLPTWRSYYY